MVTAGRPKKFDETEVLERAMLLFWEQGYEGTSLAQLRDSMGLSSASLYHSFGSKEGVFARAIKHYVSRPGSVASLTAHGGTSPRTVIESLLHRTVDEQANRTHPPGCMVALAATVGSSDDSSRARDIVKDQRAADQQHIRAIVELGISSGALRVDAPVEALTLLIHTFILGLATQVHDGMDVSTLHGTADTILSTWDAYAA